MYDDKYRTRFSSVAAATYSNEICIAQGCNNKVCTHIHNHRDLEILVVKQGKAYFTVDDHSFLAESGDVIFINPYEVHSSYTRPEYTPFSYYCITFDTAMLLASPLHPANEMCRKLTDGSMKIDHLLKDMAICDTVLNTEKIFIKKEEGWEFFLSCEIFMFFGLVYQNKLYSLETKNLKKHLFIKEVLEYIENHFSENISSGDAAEALSYDKSYFCRLFRKSFKQSFGEYLNFYRINHAAELLHNGSSVAEAAISSGFNNLSYFTKVFKAQNNCLPSKLKSFTQSANNQEEA